MNFTSYPPHDPRYRASKPLTPAQPDPAASGRVMGIFKKIRIRKSFLIGGVALIAVLGGFYYFSAGTGVGGLAGGAGRGRGGQAAPVRVAAVERRDMPVVEKTIGTVVAASTVSVTSRVQGQLNEAHFNEGDYVKKGDLLFTLDQRPFEASLAQARATLAKDQAQAADAQRNKTRYASLTEQGAASSQQRDTAATVAETTGATVEADKAAVQTAELNLSFTEIRAPIDGKTGPILIQPGNIVSANSSSPLVVIAQTQPVKVSFALPQSDLPRIQSRQRSLGLTAKVDLSNLGGRTLTAPVDFVGNIVSATSGTIELRATFDNSDLSLVPGQLVDVVVELNKIPSAVVVPREAINDGPDGQYVYVIDGDRAAQHTVKPLFDDGTYVAIEGDVRPGDQVVTEGQLRVLPNGLVTVLPARGAETESGAASAAPGGDQAAGRRGPGRRGQGGQAATP